MKSMRVIDFFCGAGGFSEGFRQEGFDIIMGIDNWAPGLQTHNLNHELNDSPRSVLDFEDIGNILNLPDSEIIVGSPPCVSFSLSNKGGNGDKTLGIRLIKAYLRVVAVKKHQPGSILKAWLMENVPNSRNYVQEFYTFEDLNLSDWAVLNGMAADDIALSVKDNGAILKASDYGSPQARSRFVCGENITSGKFPMPKPNADEKFLSDVLKCLPSPMENNIDNIVVDPNYPVIKINQNEITDHFYDTGVYEVEWRKALAAKRNHPYMGPMSFPENPDKPSRTLLATRSASTREAILYKSELSRVGDGEYRIPTVREGASLMGFPLTYIFFGNESQKWRQIGNAVCPQLSASLARQIKKELGITLEPSKFNRVDIESSNITFLDNPTPKKFDTPPMKNPKAAFRGHPVKSGNMTVALTNRFLKSDSKWTAVAYVGTGKEYKASLLSYKHYKAAKSLIEELCPAFLSSIENDNIVRFVSQSNLDRFNAMYHYNDTSGQHPLSIVNRIGEIITNVIESHEDEMVDVADTELYEVKERIPLSQIMAIYAVSTLVIDIDTVEGYATLPKLAFAS